MVRHTDFDRRISEENVISRRRMQLDNKDNAMNAIDACEEYVQSRVLEIFFQCSEEESRARRQVV